MILLWIIIANATLATLILCGTKLHGFLSRPADQGEDAFDRNPNRPRYRHAKRPAEWENFPHVTRSFPQSGQPSHDVAEVSRKAAPPALNELVSDGLSLDAAAELYALGASLARSFARERIPIDLGDETAFVNADLTMDSDSGSHWDGESTTYWFACNSEAATDFLNRLDEFLIDKNEERISSLVRRDLPKPRTNRLWLVETGELHSLYESSKWEDPYRRSHCAKPKKDREGKSWTSFDGRHMNCRKRLADMLNE
jgi:hypothetical protein